MALCLLSFTMASSIVNYFLFKPPEAAPYSFPTNTIRLKTSRGNEIAATFIDRPGATITILLSHGNSEDLNGCYNFMLKLSVILDVNVLGYDYSGYGQSTGTPSEDDCYADIDCVYEYATEKRKISPENIVLYGRSLGSGPSCYLASKTAADGRSVAGLVLHSPFTSVYRVVLPDLGFTMIGDPFPNIDRMSEIRCPVFILHGQADKIVPYSHGLALLKALPEKGKTEFFSAKGMGHNRIEYAIEMALMEALHGYLVYQVKAGTLYR